MLGYMPLEGCTLLPTSLRQLWILARDPDVVEALTMPDEVDNLQAPSSIPIDAGYM